MVVRILTFSALPIILLAVVASTASAIAPVPLAPDCADPDIDKPAPIPIGVKPEPQPRVVRGERGVKSIEVNGAVRAVNFETHKATIRPSKGTVVYMCGGPGVVYTSEGRPESIPPDLDVVVFDYLGTGQNERTGNVEELSIESQGQVVTGLVKSLGLQNYVLYGSSFGTTVATVAASQLSRGSGAIKPKMVILDGVVSRGADLNHEAAVSRAANRTWELLSDSDRRKFGEVYDQKTKNMSATQRAELDSRIIQALQAGPRIAAEMLRDFIKGKEAEDHFVPQTVSGNRQYRAAGCQQLRPRTAPAQDRFLGGRVQNTRIGVDAPGEPSPCDCPLINRPFDSASHQIQGVPVLYINSEFDVSTPIEGARRHLQSQ